jgi:hypothetical protein
MQINLNQLFTTKDVQKLLASKDDSQNRQLRVTSKGVAQALTLDILMAC